MRMTSWLLAMAGVLPLAGHAAADDDFSQKDATAVEPIDPVLEAVCMKALAKKPEDRFQTCRAFWEAIHGFVEAREKPL